ncbi:hypothetical protein [Psychrobacillus sp. NPDC093180]|uniref:hypothetical protein n=1 Tax=Psychrobacillus sp. NPDC093180 TaxID=3364489 RepID=UPI0038117E1B
MLKSFGILLVAAVIVYLEVPSLVKKKQKKELIVFSVLLAIGVGLGVLHSFGKPIPNPTQLLTFIFKPLHHLLSR